MVIATAVLLPALYQMSQKADGSVLVGATDAMQDQILKFSRGVGVFSIIVSEAP